MWWRHEAGQSLVEFSLTLPLLVYTLIGGADLARAYALQLAVQNGARAGAEAAAIDFAPTELATKARALDEMGRTPSLDPLQAVVSVTFKRADGTTDCVNPPTIAAPCFATVRVQYTFRTVIPWPLIPNVANFDRTTVMRMMAAP